MNDMPKITQDMINLYDRFTHVTRDRASYLEELTKLVGDAQTAQCVTALIQANAGAAPVTPENDSRLTMETITLPNGLVGYLAMPKGETRKLPGVIVIHENRGLVPHIKDVVRRVAAEGFIAFGPDYLAPLGGTPEDEDLGRDMIAKLERPAVIDLSLKSIDFLRAHAACSAKIGGVGFCWGGGIANATAVAAGDKLQACVAYYGAQPKAEDAAKIRARLMLHYAGEDERINAGIPAFKDALEANKTAHDIFVYPGAQHAFNNDSAPARYHKEASDLAWGRTISMFKTALQ